MLMSKEKIPVVSVLLPVYNCAEYLTETLFSLLVQTFEDFEVIAINDGSTDNSLGILNKFASIDTRIRVVSRENRGIVSTLNEAASLARGKYLARIDGDDIALPKRFAMQTEILNTKHSCVLVASTFDVINENSEHLYHDSVPTIEADLRMSMYTRNPIAHGSVMMRKDIFEKIGGYSANCGPTEDYELWQRMIKHGTVHTINTSLFRWRVNPTGITSTKSKHVEKFMKNNVNLYWNENPFTVIPRRTLVKHCRYYLSHDKLHGIATKNTVLRDLANLSVELAKRGRKVDAAKQAYIIASTGRTGIKIVWRRLLAPVKFHSRKMLGIR